MAVEPSAPDILLVQKVNHAYGRGRLILQDVSFTVAEGECVALLGRSGCGKSTLLHLIAGLTKPQNGAIATEGRAVDGPSPRRVAMFQQPSLFPWMTVAANAGIGLRFSGLPKAMIEPRISDLLRMVELSELAGANVQQLSGGQQQRVALARALAMQPRILLLDEPFSALDAFTRAALQHQVRALAKSLGLTVVLVTHDIDESVLMADRILVMQAAPGRIAAEHAILLTEISRHRGDPAFRREREALTRLFAAVTGSDAVGDADAADTDFSWLPRAAAS